MHVITGFQNCNQHRCRAEAELTQGVKELSSELITKWLLVRYCWRSYTLVIQAESRKISQCRNRGMSAGY